MSTLNDYGNGMNVFLHTSRFGMKKIVVLEFKFQSFAS